MRIDPKELLFFRVMVTPIVIQFVFWIWAGLAVLTGLGQIFSGLRMGGGAGIGLVFIGLGVLLLGPLIARIYCEMIIILFKIFDELKAVRTGQPPAQEPVNPPEQVIQ